MIKETIKFAAALASLQEFQEETDKTLETHEGQLRKQNTYITLLLEKLKGLEKENEELRDRILRIEDRQIAKNDNSVTVLYAQQDTLQDQQSNPCPTRELLSSSKND